MPDRRLVDVFETEWRTLDELCRDLDPEDWDRPTDCPGWTVKDQLSHLTGTESLLLGYPAPEVDLPDYAHVRDAIGRTNEIQVEARRTTPPGLILEELTDLVEERLTGLRALSDEEWEALRPTPAGRGDTGLQLRTRIFDWWGHEQDIRRATDRPGHLEGPVVEVVRDQIVGALGYVVGKLAGCGDGTVVGFEVTGDHGGSWTVGVTDGRGELVDDATPAATLRCDLDTLARLAMGRETPGDAVTDRRLSFEGDDELAARVADSLTITP